MNQEAKMRIIGLISETDVICLKESLKNLRRNILDDGFDETDFKEWVNYLLEDPKLMVDL